MLLSAKKGRWLASLALIVAGMAASGVAERVAAQPSDRVPNERAAISDALSRSGRPWTLADVEFPGGLRRDIQFEEVQVFAPNSSLLIQTEDGFEQQPREQLRVFRGRSDQAPDGLAILIERADGRLQGSWEEAGNRYELAMEKAASRLGVEEKPAEQFAGNPFESDEARPPGDPQARMPKGAPPGKPLPFDLQGKAKGKRLGVGRPHAINPAAGGGLQIFPFSVDASAGFRVQLSGASGDADLYVIDAETSTPTTYRCAPLLAGSEEACVIRSGNASGEYLIAVDGVTSAGPLELEVGILLTLGPGQLYSATIAVDTDYEMVQQLGSVGNVSAYLASLFAYLNATYESEISTRLLIGSQVIPSSASADPYDPWDLPDPQYRCSTRLNQVTDRYNGNLLGGSLIAHFSPSGGNCGVAWSPWASANDNTFSGVLCDATYGVSVNNVYGSAPGATTPISSSWDAIVTAHEIGHNFSSPHSHCYGELNGGSLSQNSNPVDACYTLESDPANGTNVCASGSSSLPSTSSLTGGSPGAGNGVIMSYCHLFSGGGGLGNISRTFGQGHTSGILPGRVAERMSMAVANASALGGSCIGVVDDNASNNTLSVSVTGSGQGAITSSPSGINCGFTNTNCQSTFEPDTVVTLTATPGGDSDFGGWGGDCAGSGSTCQLTMDAGKSVSASFNSSSSIIALSDGVPSGSLSGGTGSNQDFSIVVPAGTDRLRVTLAVGSGDPDIYVDTEYPPVTNSPEYDDPPYPLCSSVNGPGTDELCEIDNPDPATYYIRVNGWSTFDGAVLTASNVTVYEVTPSVIGGGGTISPSSPVSVEENGTATFSLIPDAGYLIGPVVGGSCPPGELSGSTYTTGAILGDCTVQATFEADPTVPLSPVITDVTAGDGSLTIGFTPSSSGPVADSFTATCVPNDSSSSATEFQMSPVASSQPDRSGLDALRTPVHRCAADAKRLEHEQQGWAASDTSTADCSLYNTTILGDYDPLTSATYVIPVYWHVIRTSSGQGNVSTANIEAQMAVLNEDFGAVFDTTIRFELAGITETINDNWFTDSASDEAAYKAALGVDQSRYLNVYTNDAGGALGYATFPAQSAGNDFDGVVMNYAYVGGRNLPGAAPYDLGRTLVHEVGHYLGLWHTFQGNGGQCANTFNSGDYIVDTPPHDSPDYGTSGTPVCGGVSAIENFMNYSDDVAMDRFSPQQSNRMVCSLINYRPLLYQVQATGFSAIGPASPLTVTGLTNGTSYSCSVVASNAEGTASSPSAALSGTPTAPTTPGVPVITRFDVGDGEIYLYVDADDDGGSPILEYWVTCEAGGVSNDFYFSEPPIQITGLTNGTAYQCSVRVRNNQGWSDPSPATEPLVPDVVTRGLPIWLLYQATQ